MEVGAVVALVISGISFLWTLYRDKSGDGKQLADRVIKVETKLVLTESTLNRLENEQDELKRSLKSVESQINQINVKIERILTILEKE